MTSMLTQFSNYIHDDFSVSHKENIARLQWSQSAEVKIQDIVDSVNQDSFAEGETIYVSRDIYQKVFFKWLYKLSTASLVSSSHEDYVIGKISHRLRLISERKDDWNDKGSKAPDTDALLRAKDVLVEVYDLVKSNKLLWLNPFISSDEDGLITVVWHGDGHTLHLTISPDEVEYVKVWRDKPNTYLEAGEFNNSNRLSLWDWLIMNEDKVINDDEILYRNVHSDREKYGEYTYERGELKILAEAFVDYHGTKPSVDRASVVNNNPHEIRMGSSGVVSISADEIRKIDTVVTTTKIESVYHDVDVVFSPSKSRPAHSEIIVNPDFSKEGDAYKKPYRHLRMALADIATDSGGWTIKPE